MMPTFASHLDALGQLAFDHYFTMSFQHYIVL